MKKFIALLLALAMVLSLAACSVEKAEEPAATQAPAAEAPAAEAPAANAPAAEAPAAEKAKIGGMLASLSFDFQVQMSNGIQRAADEFGYEYMPYDYNFDAEAMLSGLDVLKASNHHSVI